jgi:hypothetical protein
MIPQLGLQGISSLEKLTASLGLPVTALRIQNGRFQVFCCEIQSERSKLLRWNMQKYLPVFRRLVIIFSKYKFVFLWKISHNIFKIQICIPMKISFHFLFLKFSLYLFPKIYFTSLKDQFCYQGKYRVTHSSGGFYSNWKLDESHFDPFICFFHPYLYLGLWLYLDCLTPFHLTIGF